jgi:Putative addiction module component
MPNKDELLSHVLRLPAEERAKVAQELLLSLDEAKDVDPTAEWVSELDKRAQEALSGTAELEDWSAVRERLLARLRKH